MDETQTVMQVALTMVEAIARRDVTVIPTLLAPGFLHRTPGVDAKDAETFCAAIQQIPGEIAFVKISNVSIDVAGDSALVTGTQHARVRIEGQDIDDHRAFVDWMVRHEGQWKFRLAVDLPAVPEQRAADGS
jgi:ketosteroid isomerase-like protein